MSQYSVQNLNCFKYFFNSGLNLEFKIYYYLNKYIYCDLEKVNSNITFKYYFSKSVYTVLNLFNLNSKYFSYLLVI